MPYLTPSLSMTVVDVMLAIVVGGMYYLNPAVGVAVLAFIVLDNGNNL